MSKNNDSQNNCNACVVCYKNVEIYSIGMCEHPVCYECSTRMRVLCQQNECPICRQDLPKVVFTREVKPFRHLKKGDLLDTRYNIYFDSEDIREKFMQLLANKCRFCGDAEHFENFYSLKDHMRRKHELHYCDLCVENLKIFSHERRCYTRPDLALHRRKGDVDDKSHKGHPLCEFCDQRYMDNDELYRHLRRDHLYCHFCDADGLHQYYSSYDYLREHFRHEHFLCEEGPCAEEKFTSVFRTDIDLRAHKAGIHGKQLGKAAAKQARTLELEFTLAPRGEGRGPRRGGQGPSGSRGPREYNNNSHAPGTNHQETGATGGCPAFPSQPEEEQSLPKQQPSVDVLSTEEFPTLGNAVPIVPQLGSSKGTRGNVTIRSTLRPQPLAVTDENFPALGPESTPGGISKVNLSVSSSNKLAAGRAPRAPGNVSIRVDHKANGTVTTTRVSGPNIRIRPALSMDADFPALGPGTTAASAQWTRVTCTRPAAAAQARPKKSVAPSGEDFPSLLDPARAKRQPAMAATAWTGDDNTKAKTKKKKPKNGGNSGNESGNNSKVGGANKTPKKEQDGPSRNKETEKAKESTKSTEEEKRKPKSEDPEEEPESINKDIDTLPRKRSELKIESPNSTSSPEVRLEEFPALGGGSSGPPGFSNPPPGFNAAPPPPPGFFVKLNSVQRLPGDNGLTFTNSSGETYSILPDREKRVGGFPYLLPPDFQKRNKSLEARVKDVLGEPEALDEFRRASGRFRQGICSPEEYYEHCRRAMGVVNFETVFNELLVLLPDVEKQKELYRVHRKVNQGKTKGLEACANCGQVLKSGTDFRSHVADHTMENHFPALGKAWVRK
ncbi:E3 ubiquitin-protein ligase ZNF598 [Orussus abietinus]|uniref:E3 ubiquitin-protein ligase ZNF598 n=1 Tax=Orussus abietinus TaxID=222816 RepID=UPI0006260ADF|nr:E3 ubiquitin-protein ligase ZNF598 [Orussus abietinus]